MLGKVSPEDLKKFVFSRVGAASESVQVGPAYGEDTAAIEIGGEVLVINSDPIIYAAEGIGTLGVNIASNDVAASGGKPEWMTVTYLLPDEENSVLDTITRQIDSVARDLGIAIVGGHSEYVPEVRRPFLSLTCFGRADRYIPTSGAEPGDRVILTKGAGIEGTGIIATDFRSELEDEVDPELLQRGEERLNELSVVPEASVLNDYATAMHDPTEGGLVDGLLELSSASSVRLEIDRSRIVIGDDTRALCDAMEVDPMKIFGSGALLATVPEDRADEAIELLLNRGISASVIGKVEKGEPELVIGEEVYRDPIRDELYDLWG
uniref:AIR synthase related protein domain protein n=1 Tax=uncultured organism TaxID=155900 RepID=M1P0S4_9ZZZZ|nr:AIR synthase related protein domain protein [uncultured organism]